MPGEFENILAAFCAALADSLGSVPVWWPNATFNQEGCPEYCEVPGASLGPGSGRRGERSSTWSTEVFCVARKQANLMRAHEIAELVRAGVEDLDLAIAGGGILRLTKPGIEGEGTVGDLQFAVVRIEGRYHRA